MSKKNTTKKNADIEAVAEVASAETAAIETAELDTPTVVTADEATEAPEGDEPEASASVEIASSEGVPQEHKILVKSDTGVTEVHVKAVTRQDAKYRVYLQLDQFGPNAKVPKFDIDKYLARKSSAASPKKGGGKKGEKKARNVVVVDLDAPVPEEPVTDNIPEEAATAED